MKENVPINLGNILSFLFSLDPLKDLFDDNDLMAIIRGHEVQIEGYKMHKWEGEDAFPHVITVFSAPNYCNCYSNKAAIIIMDVSFSFYSRMEI
jgi:serine/threonine-protein phosphatase 2B catalytic subunit